MDTLSCVEERVDEEWQGANTNDDGYGTVACLPAVYDYVQIPSIDSE